MKINDLPYPPVAGAREAGVCGLRNGRRFDSRDWVAEEVPVALVYNGISHAVMLATPADLEDFALGFTLTEGIVDDASHIYGVELVPPCDAGQRGLTLAVDISARSEMRLKDRRRTLAGRTGCGLCGTDSLEQAVREPRTLPQTASFGAAGVSRALARMREQQMLLGVTGASHAAAWCTPEGDVLMLREDVGRHNALDKLVGALVRQGKDTREGFVAVTSRASYEMVHKTAWAGVQMLAAISGVTGLAIEMAEQAGLTLVGFARGQDLSAYSHVYRLGLGPWPGTGIPAD